MAPALPRNAVPGEPGGGSAAVSRPAGQAARALADLARGARLWHLWTRLGAQDVRARYRRSVLGPFWITLSMGLLVVVLGGLYGRLFRVGVPDYLPYVAIGLVVWGLVSGLVTDGCNVFFGARRIIHDVGLPLSVLAYRMVWRNLLVFLHHAIVLVPVGLTFSAWPGWTGLLALPGLAAVCLNGVWVALFAGTVGARFRDVPPIVDSVMRIAWLGTPVIWMPALVPERGLFVRLNPFHHVLEVVRAPLLGTPPAAESWLVVGLVTVAGWAATLFLFARCRRRIAYWV